MENSNCDNSHINSGIHFGDTVQINWSVVVEKGGYRNSREKCAVASLIKKEPLLNVVGRFVASAVSFLADYFTLILALKTKFSNIWLAVVIFLVFATIGLYLLCTFLSLILNGRLGRLRRIGGKVYRIKTNDCPICKEENHKGKLRLIYNSDSNHRDGEGNYVVCSNDPKNHYWYVTFPKENK